MASLCQKLFHALVLGLPFIQLYMGTSLCSFIYFLYVSVHMGMHVCPGIWCCGWIYKSGDNLKESVLSFHLWVTISNSDCQAY